MVRLGNFNANDVEPLGDFQPIPAGKYLAKIVESEMKQNKAKTGEFLELKFQVVEGQYKGRTVIARLNLKHENVQTREIAKKTLSSICRAVGVMSVQDSQQLHNIPMEITVSVGNPDDNGNVYNEVKNYAKRGASVAVQQPQNQNMQNPVQDQAQDDKPDFMA